MQYLVRSFHPSAPDITERTVEASSAEQAREQFRAGGAVVLSVVTVTAPGWRPWAQARANFPLFCREVRTLIQAGMTVVEAVDTLAARERLRTAQDAQRGLASILLQRLQQGQSLSVALAGMAGTPAVLIAAVRAGERTSNLGEALDDYLKFDQLVEQLRRKVVSAAIYPALVTGLGIAISVFLLLVVLPNFARMYQNLNGAISSSAALMIRISLFVSQNQVGVLFALAIFAFALAWWAVTGRAKATAMRWGRAIPYVRQRIGDFELAMVYQALALLLKGGYPMTEAVAIAARSALTPELQSALTGAQARIETGGQVSESFSRFQLCDEVDRRLMAAAERNGDFYRAADVVARLHGERFELFVERMTRIVEPVLLMLVALMVGSIVIMMYLPVFDVATRLR